MQDQCCVGNWVHYASEAYVIATAAPLQTAPNAIEPMYVSNLNSADWWPYCLFKGASAAQKYTTQQRGLATAPRRSVACQLSIAQ
jgi:hypothetical protein